MFLYADRYSFPMPLHADSHSTLIFQRPKGGVGSRATNFTLAKYIGAGGIRHWLGVTETLS